MGESRTIRFVIGVIALILGAVVLVVTGRLVAENLIPPPTYAISADFENVGGLKTGDEIQIGGVTIGHVARISLEKGRAHVVMRIERSVRISSDAVAEISTAGIVGGRYIAIIPGRDQHYLSEGDTLRHTHSALILDNALEQLFKNVGKMTGSDSEKRQTE